MLNTEIVEMKMRFFSGKKLRDNPAKASKQHASGKVDVVRTLTLPNGKKIRVMRKDALDRALSRPVHAEVA